MNCVRCGKPISQGAAFCMHCGAPSPTPQATVQAADPRTGPHAAVNIPSGSVSQAFNIQRKRNNIILAICAAVAGLLGIFFGLRAAGLLQLGQKTGVPVLTAKGSNGNAVMQQVASGGPAVTQQKEQIISMPDDIREWLEHLRKTEEKRVHLTQGQLTDALVEKTKGSIAGGADAVQALANGIDDPNSEMKPPTEGLARLLKKMHDDCVGLTEHFDSVKPPEECVPIRNAYDQALNETSGELGDIADHLAAGDIDRLLKMKGQSKANIDSPAKTTDRLVGEICEKYHTRRWFSIQSDIGTSGLFGGL